MTCTAATNSAPSSRYSPASAAITAISESALLIGCRCASKLTRPPTQVDRPANTNCPEGQKQNEVETHRNSSTRPQQSPRPPGSQSPAATETSSQTTSVGHSGSAATSRAPRYTERENRKP